MKRLSAIVILLALLCTACGGQTNPSASGAETAASAVAQQAEATSAVLPTAAAAGAQSLDDPTDASKAATDSFAITSEAGAIEPVGAVYTITGEGEYTVTGALSDGQLVIDAGEGEVKLTLANASVSCSTGAPILIRSAGKVTIKAEKDSYNTVTDLRTGSTDAVEDDAAIWAACDLSLSGAGTLIVTSDFDNGIKTKDDLKIKALTLKVTAKGNALKGNDSVEIKSGALILVSTASDGVKTENSDVSEKGNRRGTVSILGGQVDIYAACDGISAAYNVEISEKDTCIVNIFTASYATDAESAAAQVQYLIVPTALYSDTDRYYAYLYNDDDTAGVWVECTYETMVYSGRSASYYGLAFCAPDGYRNILFEIVPGGTTPDGGNYTAATDGDTRNADMNGYLIASVSGSRISGDWVQLTDSRGGSDKTTYSSKGVKAANEIVIDGGTITVCAMDDGLHANGGDTLEDGSIGLGNVTVNGGTLSVTCADDGIHADGSLVINGGTVRIVKSHEGLEANLLTQNGGSIFVYADDDGLNACKGDATPMVTINGGTAEIKTASGDTDAIDSNGSFLMTGGTVLVLGGAAMGNMAGSVDVDGTVTVTGGTILALGGVCQVPSGSSVNTYVSGNASLSAGSYRLVDANGDAILSFTLSESYSGLWVASDVFAQNGSYTIERDGTALLTWTQTSQIEGSYQSGFGGPGFGGRGGR